MKAGMGSNGGGARTGQYRRAHEEDARTPGIGVHERSFSLQFTARTGRKGGRRPFVRGRGRRRAGKMVQVAVMARILYDLDRWSGPHGAGEARRV